MIDRIMSTLQDVELRKAFGLRLKQLRKAKGLTQKELAASLGIFPTHLNKYEAGTSAPPLEKLAALADLLAVSLDYLVLGKETNGSQLANTGLLERFKRIETFDRRDQETVAELIDAMIAKSQMRQALRPIPV